MILLDTNVISEPLRPAGDAAVLAWIDAQIVETLYLSAISLAELRLGMATLPAQAQRRASQQLLSNAFCLCSPAGYCPLTVPRQKPTRCCAPAHGFKERPSRLPTGTLPRPPNPMA